MEDSDRKYRFSWNLLGNLKVGRPSLGPLASIEAYRLMQYTFRDVIEQEFGSEKADEIFYKAGFIAGTEFYTNVIGSTYDINTFLKKLQDALVDMRIGILRIEKTNPESGEFVLSISEDLDCSGLPETGQGVCTFDEGFIAGIMKAFTGIAYSAKEIDCWCTGDRTCRFMVWKS